MSDGTSITQTKKKKKKKTKSNNLQWYNSNSKP